MAWMILIAAGAAEIVMAAALKAASGWTRPVPSAIGVGAALLSIWLLARALRALPTGTAYAVWTGIGAIGVCTLGIVVDGDSAALPRLLCITAILAGIIGLRFLDG